MPYNIDQTKGTIRLSDRPNRTKDLHSLEHRRRVADLSLFEDFIAQDVRVEVPTSRTSLLRHSFFWRTSTLWNKLPGDLLPDDYNLQRLKYNHSKIASRDPSKWMQWYIELQSSEGEQGEEVLGEADPDEDDGDFTTRSDHNSESEQEAEEPEDGDNSEWLSDSENSDNNTDREVSRWFTNCRNGGSFNRRITFRQININNNMFWYDRVVSIAKTVSASQKLEVLFRSRKLYTPEQLLLLSKAPGNYLAENNY
ncbi:unnamed protein product [Callosobruchus maculatus]|uniref:Uncharacterized protein n=1 Tax=Callosobruchus maculatus TaxID=64391 RepID=A0A653D2I5_CALMS|nr:unnamed protein product [Callosobruchus maculatus]